MDAGSTGNDRGLSVRNRNWVVFCVGFAVVGLLISCSRPESGTNGRQPDDVSHGDTPALLVHYESAMEAGNKEDWAAARDAFIAGIEIAPNAPVLHFHAARTFARLGNSKSCREHLETVIRLGGTADLAADEAFASLLDQPGFEELARSLRNNGEPPPAAEILHRFTDTELWPEGVAVDSETGDVYVGSIHRRVIHLLTPDGRLEEVGSRAEDGLMEVIGIWVDAPRRALWAVTGEGEWKDPNEGPPRRNELVRYDLSTGLIDGRWNIPDDELRLLNDVVVGPDGTAWATESLRGEVFRVTPDGELELFARFPELVFLNGIAISDDGGILYLGHFAGLSVVSPDDRTIKPVPGRDMALGMVDGLSWADDNRLVLVQNSHRVNFRVVRVDLDAGGRTAERLEILRSGLPEGLIPYTSAIDGDSVIVVAAAPFDLMDRGEAPPPPVVVRFPLTP